MAGYSEEFKKEIIALYNSGLGAYKIANKFKDHREVSVSVDSFRRSVNKIVKKASHGGLFTECENVGINPEDVSTYWYKGKHYSIKANPNKDTFNTQEFTDNLVELVKSHAPSYPKIVRVKQTDGHCLVFDPSDIHIGKLCSSFETGEDYNQQIAVKRVMEGLDGIIQKSNGFNIDKIIFVAGNDVLHTDNPRRQTTSQTPQDTDGMWYDNFIHAKRLLIDIIEKLVTIADVEVVYNPSNHDFMSGFMLLQCVEAFFSNTEQVTFQANMSHRKYSIYGANLISTTHMDGAKVADLPLLMAHEASKHWHDCKHRYIYGHHVHHKTAKDIFSVCVETLRSPSGADSWHHRKGYQFAPQAVEAFIHHPLHGQVARLTHLF